MTSPKSGSGGPSPSPFALLKYVSAQTQFQFEKRLNLSQERRDLLQKIRDSRDLLDVRKSAGHNLEGPIVAAKRRQLEVLRKERSRREERIDEWRELYYSSNKKRTMEQQDLDRKQRQLQSLLQHRQHAQKVLRMLQGGDAGDPDLLDQEVESLVYLKEDSERDSLVEGQASVAAGALSSRGIAAVGSLRQDSTTVSPSPSPRLLAREPQSQRRPSPATPAAMQSASAGGSLQRRRSAVAGATSPLPQGDGRIRPGTAASSSHEGNAEVPVPPLRTGLSPSNVLYGSVPLRPKKLASQFYRLPSSRVASGSNTARSMSGKEDDVRSKYGGLSGDETDDDDDDDDEDDNGGDVYNDQTGGGGGARRVGGGGFGMGSDDSADIDSQRSRGSSSSPDPLAKVGSRPSSAKVPSTEGDAADSDPKARSALASPGIGNTSRDNGRGLGRQKRSKSGVGRSKMRERLPKAGDAAGLHAQKRVEEVDVILGRSVTTSTRLLFHHVTSLLKALWSDIHENLSYQTLFSKQHFSRFSEESYNAIGVEIGRVLRVRDCVYMIERWISIREAFLVQLHDMCRVLELRIGNGGSAVAEDLWDRQYFVSQIEDYMTGLRTATVIVVEAYQLLEDSTSDHASAEAAASSITWARYTSASGSNKHSTGDEDYRLKMRHDVDFLLHSAVQMFTDVQLNTYNPLLLPAPIFARYSLASDLERYRKMGGSGSPLSGRHMSGMFGSITSHRRLSNQSLVGGVGGPPGGDVTNRSNSTAVGPSGGAAGGGSAGNLMATLFEDDNRLREQLSQLSRIKSSAESLSEFKKKLRRRTIMNTGSGSSPDKERRAKRSSPPKTADGKAVGADEDPDVIAFRARTGNDDDLGSCFSSESDGDNSESGRGDEDQDGKSDVFDESQLSAASRNIAPWNKYSVAPKDAVGLSNHGVAADHDLPLWMQRQQQQQQQHLLTPPQPTGVQRRGSGAMSFAAAATTMAAVARVSAAASGSSPTASPGRSAGGVSPGRSAGGGSPGRGAGGSGGPGISLAVELSQTPSAPALTAAELASVLVVALDDTGGVQGARRRSRSMIGANVLQEVQQPSAARRESKADQQLPTFLGLPGGMVPPSPSSNFGLGTVPAIVATAVSSPGRPASPALQQHQHIAAGGVPPGTSTLFVGPSPRVAAGGSQVSPNLTVSPGRPPTSSLKATPGPMASPYAPAALAASMLRPSPATSHTVAAAGASAATATKMAAVGGHGGGALPAGHSHVRKISSDIGSLLDNLSSSSSVAFGVRGFGGRSEQSTGLVGPAKLAVERTKHYLKRWSKPLMEESMARQFGEQREQALERSQRFAGDASSEIENAFRDSIGGTEDITNVSSASQGGLAGSRPASRPASTTVMTSLEMVTAAADSWGFATIGSRPNSRGASRSPSRPGTALNGSSMGGGGFGLSGNSAGMGRSSSSGDGSDPSSMGVRLDCTERVYQALLPKFGQANVAQQALMSSSVSASTLANARAQVLQHQVAVGSLGQFYGGAHGGAAAEVQMGRTLSTGLVSPAASSDLASSMFVNAQASPGLAPMPGVPLSPDNAGMSSSTAVGTQKAARSKTEKERFVDTLFDSLERIRNAEHFILSRD